MDGYFLDVASWYDSTGRCSECDVLDDTHCSDPSNSVVTCPRGSGFRARQFSNCVSYPEMFPTVE